MYPEMELGGTHTIKISTGEVREDAGTFCAGFSVALFQRLSLVP